MSQRDPQSSGLPPDVRALLESERDVPAPPAEVRERVFERLESTLGPLDGGPGESGGDDGGQGGGDGSGGGDAPNAGAQGEPSGAVGGDAASGGAPGELTRAVEAAGGQAAVSAEASSATKVGLAALMAKPLPLAVLTFVAGAATGAGVHAALTDSSREEAQAPRSSDGAPSRGASSPGERSDLDGAGSPKSTPEPDGLEKSAPRDPNRAAGDPPEASGGGAAQSAKEGATTGVSGATRPEMEAPLPDPPAEPRRRPARRPGAAAARPAPHEREPGRAKTEPGGATGLSSEHALLERARVALARGRPNDALEALDQHRHRFPGSQHAEERDALAVQGLVNAGYEQRAREVAAEFRRRYPRSLFGSVVERALEELEGKP